MILTVTPPPLRIFKVNYNESEVNITPRPQSSIKFATVNIGLRGKDTEFTTDLVALYILEKV